MNFRQLLEEKAAKNGDKIFLYHKDLEVSYRQINNYANKCADMFQKLGVGPGDKVALILPNCPEFLYAWFGLSKLGAVEVPINSRLRGMALRHQIVYPECKGVVIGKGYVDALDEISAQLTSLQFIVVVGLEGEEGDKLLSFNSLFDQSSAQFLPEVLFSDEHPISIMFTSGTTGVAKGVVNSHEAYLAAGRDLVRLLEVTPEDRCYVCLPLFHGNPQMMVVMTTLMADCAMVLAEKFSASGFWEEINRYQATMFSYVGTILAILCKQQIKAGEGNNSVRFCFGGGAPKQIWEEFKRRFNVEILEAYGLIEAGCVTTINRPDSVRFGSVGTPRECFEVKMFNDKDEDAPAGEVGEIVVRPLKPYHMFSGYYRMPEDTLKSYRNLWFHTGDLGWLDSDGYFHFAGRLKHVIRRKGENISPYEIENIINTHPKVLECAVVGVPDDIAGEEIKACIVAKPGMEIRPEEIISWCPGKIADFMVPRYIQFKDRLEKTASEKIQAFKLKDEGIGDAWDREKSAGK